MGLSHLLPLWRARSEVTSILRGVAALNTVHQEVAALNSEMFDIANVDLRKSKFPSRFSGACNLTISDLAVLPEDNNDNCKFVFRGRNATLILRSSKEVVAAAAASRLFDQIDQAKTDRQQFLLNTIKEYLIERANLRQEGQEKARINRAELKERARTHRAELLKDWISYYKNARLEIAAEANKTRVVMGAQRALQRSAAAKPIAAAIGLATVCGLAAWSAGGGKMATGRCVYVSIQPS